ncbi:hypothetical protein C3F00_037655, partial [Pseudomonas sp. MWU13-2860]
SVLRCRDRHGDLAPCPTTRPRHQTSLAPATEGTKGLPRLRWAGSAPENPPRCAMGGRRAQPSSTVGEGGHAPQERHRAGQLALQVGDGKNADGSPRWEAMANGDHGQPRGRELELAWLLREIKRRDIRNVVWFTADVHYTAAHHYHPERAAFADFNPFWEFVSGPLNAGTFGPNALDMTFGPKVVYQKAPEAQNLSPLAGLQFFGQVD